MNLITQIRNERAAVIDSMQSILDTVENENRDFNSDEEKQYRSFEQELDDFDSQLTKAERAGKLAENKADLEAIVRKAPTSGTRTDISPRSYRSLFKISQSENLSSGNFKDFREFMSVVLNGMNDPRLNECRTQVSKNGVDGGFGVPIQFGEMLIDATIAESIVLPRARIYGMENGELRIPAWDSANHTSNLYGGFTKSWVGEGDDSNVETAKLRQIKLIAKKLIIRSNASREVIEDSTSFGNDLQQAMITASASFLDEDFLSGDGVGKPLGALNDPALITVNRAVANAVSYADVRNVYGRLHPKWKAGAVWVINTDIVPELMAIVDGNNNLIFQPGTFGGIAGAVPATLFGIEIIPSELVPALGTKGDLLLANFSQYGVGLRQQVVIESSNAVNWSKDLTDFRTILRADGQGLWDKPITPRKGTNTLSWAIALDTP